MADWLSMITGLAGGIIGTGGFSAYYVARKQFEVGEIDRMRTDLAECKKNHALTEQRMEEIERQLRAVEHSRECYIARWLKDRNGCMIWCNDKAYLTLFAPLGISRTDLVGKTFEELFLDKRAVEEINALDMAAMAHPGAAQSALIQLHPLLAPMNIMKVVATDPAGELLYEGYAYHVTDPEILSAAGARRQIKQIGYSGDNLLPG